MILCNLNSYNLNGDLQIKISYNFGTRLLGIIDKNTLSTIWIYV